jgi:hypothetical protein
LKRKTENREKRQNANHGHSTTCGNDHPNIEFKTQKTPSATHVLITTFQNSRSKPPFLTPDT